MNADISPTTDEILARQAQGGDLVSFEELVLRYEARIYRFVLKICRSEADAKEVTQDAFVTAFQKLLQFDARRSFAAWLFTIARHKCVDRARQVKFGVPEVVSELADHRDPAALLEQREAERNIWKFAETALPALQFQALWLKYNEEMSVAELARVLGKTQVHVKVILFRARAALERAWEHENGARPATRAKQSPRSNSPLAGSSSNRSLTVSL